MNLDECLQVALGAARKAGEVIKAAFDDERSKMSTSWKSVADLVTETDRSVERLVFSDLRSRFPTHSFIGEETASATEVVGDSPTWVVDPIDGTTNFVHRWPMLCISIALFVSRSPVVAVVHNPVMSETFHAVRGRGAFLNGSQRLHVSPTTSIREAVISTNVGIFRDELGAKFLLE